MDWRQLIGMIGGLLGTVFLLFQIFEARIDGVNSSANTRISTVAGAMNERISAVVSATGDRIDGISGIFAGAMSAIEGRLQVQGEVNRKQGERLKRIECALCIDPCGRADCEVKPE